MKNTIGSEVKRMNKKRTKVLIAISVALVVCATACGLRPGALPKDEDKSKVMISAGDAVTGEGLSNVSVSFIPGRDNPDGEAVCQAVSGDVEGTAVELPYGEYTIEWSADGYHTGYQNMEVREEEVLVRKWMMPVFEGDAAYILMEWESETDLDLCVYNEQTGRCLGRETTLEDAGSFSHGDDDGTKGYELVFLNDYDKNTYMIYVKDNERTAEDQRTADDQGTGSDTAGITISVYASEGLIYRKRPDEEKRAALWNCACINHGRVEEQDEYIYDLTEYAWAARSKEDPALWLENASAKAEEIYSYASYNKLHEIKKKIFDMDGNELPVLFYRYDDDGNISKGYEYDARGNLLASYGYDSDGNIYYDEKNEYDEAGKLLVNYIYNDDGSIYYREENEYDEAGNCLVSYEYCFWAGYIHKHEDMYDSDGKRDCAYFYLYSMYGEEEAELLSYSVSEYDSNGNETVCRYYDGEGVLTESEEYTYDSNGNETARRYYDGEGVLTERWEYTYDRNGYAMSYRHYDGDGILISGYETEHDANGNIVAYYSYGENGVLKYKDEYQYDLNGNCISYYTYDEHGFLPYESWKCEYKYDEDGKLAAVYTYDGNEQLESKTEYKYSEDGQREEICDYENGELTSQNIKIFDANGNPRKDFKYQSGRLEAITIWEYNENGVCTSEQRYHGKYWEKHVYEYDAVGGMKIHYCYKKSRLIWKTITLFY